MTIEQFRLTSEQAVDLRRWLEAAVAGGISLRQEAATEARRIIDALTPTTTADPERAALAEGSDT